MVDQNDATGGHPSQSVFLADAPEPEPSRDVNKQDELSSLNDAITQHETNDEVYQSHLESDTANESLPRDVGSPVGQADYSDTSLQASGHITNFDHGNNVQETIMSLANQNNQLQSIGEYSHSGYLVPEPSSAWPTSTTLDETVSSPLSVPEIPGSHGQSLYSTPNLQGTALLNSDSSVSTPTEHTPALPTGSFPVTSPTTNNSSIDDYIEPAIDDVDTAAALTYQQEDLWDDWVWDDARDIGSLIETPELASFTSDRLPRTFQLGCSSNQYRCDSSLDSYDTEKFYPSDDEFSLGDPVDFDGVDGVFAHKLKNARNDLNDSTERPLPEPNSLASESNLGGSTVFLEGGGTEDEDDLNGEFMHCEALLRPIEQLFGIT